VSVSRVQVVTRLTCTSCYPTSQSRRLSTWFTSFAHPCCDCRSDGTLGDAIGRDCSLAPEAPHEGFESNVSYYHYYNVSPSIAAVLPWCFIMMHPFSTGNVYTHSCVHFGCLWWWEALTTSADDVETDIEIIISGSNRSDSSDNFKTWSKPTILGASYLYHL
jgi:hypothetical protein